MIQTKYIKYTLTKIKTSNDNKKKLGKLFYGQTLA